MFENTVRKTYKTLQDTPYLLQSRLRSLSCGTCSASAIKAGLRQHILQANFLALSL